MRLGRRRDVTRDFDADYDEHAVVTTGPEHEAAGVKAVMVSLQRGLKSMGAWRTGASLVRLNQRHGFDCPGCAWPEEHGGRKFAEFCENGAKAVAEEATKRVVTADFFARHSITDLDARPEYWLSQQGRLTEPVVLRPDDDHYRPISWDDAYRLIADELRALENPDEAVFYTSGRTSNEAAFLYQLMVRSFGTNNLPDCSNMCHESSGAALVEAIGIGKGSVTVEDVANADLIVIAGQNPGTNHPRMLSVLEKAKENGAKIIAINPLPEAGLIRFKDPQKVHGVVGHGIPIADEFVQIRLGGDMALFAGLGRLLLEADDRAPGSDRRPRLHREALRELRRVRGSDAGRRPRHRAGGDGDRARAAGEGRADDDRLRAHDRVLGDGAHPAQACRADDLRNHQRAADARDDRQARRRIVPGAWTFQRAGRSHDGHLGEDAREVPCRPRQALRHRQPA